jgi:hypothetical protein
MKKKILLFFFLFSFNQITYSKQKYTNSEECILDNVNKTNNAEASLAVIDSCRKLYPNIENKNTLQNFDKKKIEEEIKNLREILEILKKELVKFN